MEWFNAWSIMIMQNMSFQVTLDHFYIITFYQDKNGNPPLIFTQDSKMVLTFLQQFFFTPSLIIIVMEFFTGMSY